MGKQVNLNAVSLEDEQNHRWFSVEMDAIKLDDKLPTVRQLLEHFSIDTTDYPADPRPELDTSRYYAFDGSGAVIKDLDRKVVRGENIRWAFAQSGASSGI